MAKKIGLDNDFISRTDTDVFIDENDNGCLINPLRKNEFNVQIFEKYPTTDYYLGKYLPYPWPFSAKNKKNIVSDAFNYLDGFTSSDSFFSGLGEQAPGHPPQPNREVESAAIKHIKKILKNTGYHIVWDRQKDNCGYDLLGKKNGKEIHVEVKGFSCAPKCFWLTRNEFSTAERDPNWRLAIVIKALSKPMMRPYLEITQIKRQFKMEPIQWVFTKRD